MPFEPLVKQSCKNLPSAAIDDMLRRVKIAGKTKKTQQAATTASRGRNVDFDAFAEVTDRGGAAVTDYEDFM